MIYRPLGATGINVSVFSFGAWQIGDSAYWGDEGPVAADAVVHAALDAGINLFDTAEMYGGGESESALGRALGVRRKDVCVASKVLPENCHPHKLRQSCEATLQRLRTDYLDVYQIHWPPRDVDFADCYEAMLGLKKEGKIRHIGVSNFGPEDLAEWLRAGECASNQLGYNIAFRAIEHTILPLCEERNIGVLVYMPLLQGILSAKWSSVEDIPQLRRRTRHFAAGRPGTRHTEPGCEGLLLQLLNDLIALADEAGRTPAELALGWLLAQPGVTSAIIGARKPGQLLRNLTAADWVIEPPLLAQLDNIGANLKTALGPNADMWATQSRIR